MTPSHPEAPRTKGFGVWSPFTTSSPVTRCIPTREDQVAHRKGCDLVDVGGNIPDTSHTHSLNPMTTLTQVQDEQAFEALTDEELESVDGGILTALTIGVGIPLAGLAGRWLAENYS